MIFGNKTPKSAIGRVVAVVAHHKVVVHFKSVGIGRLSVDIDSSITNSQVVILVHINYPLIQRQVIQV